MQKWFPVRNSKEDEDKNLIFNFIKNLDKDKEYVVHISDISKAKSIKQLNLFFMWMSFLADILDYGYNKNDWYKIFLDMFAIKKVVKIKNKDIVISETLSDMDMEKTSKFISEVQLYCEEELIHLPVPEDKEFDWFYSVYKEIEK